VKLSCLVFGGEELQAWGSYNSLRVSDHEVVAGLSVLVNIVLKQAFIAHARSHDGAQPSLVQSSKLRPERAGTYN